MKRSVLAWSAAAAVCVFPAAGQVLDLDLTFTGNINGDELSATGDGTVDTSAGTASNASVTFDNLPGGYNPLSTSLLSNLCTVAFSFDGTEGRGPGQGGTQNLFSLTGGTYQMTRVFSWVGVANSSVTVTANVERVGNTLVSFMNLAGLYAGPVDLVGIESYTVTWLPSSTPGEFFEAGTLVLDVAGSDDPLVAQFASVFSGFDGTLDAPQVGTATFDTEFDGQTFDIGWQGEFVPPVPTPTPLAVAGVLGAFVVRRRR